MSGLHVIKLRVSRKIEDATETASPSSEMTDLIETSDDDDKDLMNEALLSQTFDTPSALRAAELRVPLTPSSVRSTLRQWSDDAGISDVTKSWRVRFGNSTSPPQERFEEADEDNDAADADLVSSQGRTTNDLFSLSLDLSGRLSVPLHPSIMLDDDWGDVTDDDFSSPSCTTADASKSTWSYGQSTSTSSSSPSNDGVSCATDDDDFGVGSGSDDSFSAEPADDADLLTLGSIMLDDAAPVSTLHVSSAPAATSAAFETRGGVSLLGALRTTARGRSAPLAGGGSPGENSCYCKNSHCLKLYCNCFSSGSTCEPSCGCSDCHNQPGDRGSNRRAEAVAKCLAHKSRTHRPKTQILTAELLASGPAGLPAVAALADKGSLRGAGLAGLGLSGKKKGSWPRDPFALGSALTEAAIVSPAPLPRCFCKKSRCVKKYCDCFNAGLECGVGRCRCTDCANLPPGVSRPPLPDRTSPAANGPLLPTAARPEMCEEEERSPVKRSLSPFMPGTLSSGGSDGQPSAKRSVGKSHGLAHGLAHGKAHGKASTRTDHTNAKANRPANRSPRLPTMSQAMQQAMSHATGALLPAVLPPPGKPSLGNSRRLLSPLD